MPSFRPAVILCAAAGPLLTVCEDSSDPAFPASAVEAKNLYVADNWPGGGSREDTFSWKAK